jgi:type IV pilus assembly protein PilM
MFRKRSRATVALDVGSNIVKCLRIDHSGERPRITNFAMVDLLPEAIVEGEIMDRDMVIDAIRECLGRAEITDDAVVSSVGGRSVIVKKILMDQMAEEDAREAILWEAEQHVPFDIDDISLDFQIVRNDVGANQMEVLLVAAKKDTIQSHADLLRDAELKPQIVDVDAFAVQNCWESTNGGPSDDVVGMINIGADVTSVCIMQNGVPYFTRDLAVGTNRFVEEIQKEFGVGLDEAREIASFPEKAEVEESRMASVLVEVAEDISTGVERSLSFLRTSGDAESIDRVVLSGGGSRFPGLAEFLHERHDVEVETSDPLSSVDYDPDTFAEYETSEIGPLLAVSVGLALRQPGGEQ